MKLIKYVNKQRRVWYMNNFELNINKFIRREKYVF